MGLTLAQALRLGRHRQDAAFATAFVGAGGKTTAMFQLARELEPPVVVTTTTHLGAWQVPLADHHIVAADTSDLPLQPEAGVTVLSGPPAPPSSDGLERFAAVPPAVLEWLHDNIPWRGLPLLIEADGAHRKPLKAPVAHEPVIPPYVGVTVVVQGLSGLGKPLSEAVVHRSKQFSALSGLEPGDPVSPEALVAVLTDPRGGLKGIPPASRRMALLNQADGDELQSQAQGVVPALLETFDAVVIASLQAKRIHAVHERVAGVVLAAGGSTRLGRPKPLLDWRGEPFVRVVAATAISAGLGPVVVVTGSQANDVSRALDGVPVQIVHNGAWETGQSSSIHAGLQALPANVGAAIFMLADQPQIGSDVIRALVSQHSAGLDAIVAPLVMMERRGNPVLFDRTTFPDLLALVGDVGGRAVFSKHHVQYVPWYDERLLLDVDTEEDYRRLLEEGRS